MLISANDCVVLNPKERKVDALILRESIEYDIILKNTSIIYQGGCPMDKKTRILYFEFSQETNSFNPLIWEMEDFKNYKYCEGAEIFSIDPSIPCETTGFMAAAAEYDLELVGSVAMWAQAGGKVNANLVDDMLEKVHEAYRCAGHVDAIFGTLHGATQDTYETDTCGRIVEYLRRMAGPEPVIAIAFDMHGNITDKILQNADVVCGYQTYPHRDAYETAYRTAKLGVMKLKDPKAFTTAAVMVPMIVPAAGYTSESGAFKEVMDRGHAGVTSGDLLDFSVFQMQPWLDANPAASTVLAIAKDGDTAARYAREIAQDLFDRRKEFWPELYSIDDVLQKAIRPDAQKPVVLVNSGDSPGCGAVGDNVSVLKRLLERGETLRFATLVRDAKAVKRAFEIGVGNKGEMTLGRGINANNQESVTACVLVRSLHDGHWIQEGPISVGLPQYNGLSAVVSIGNFDILFCEYLANTGDPQTYRHFGLEPKLYDLVEVKANMSFKLPFSYFATEFYTTAVPGCAGTAVLTDLNFKNLPAGMYPFADTDDFRANDAKLY